jgi:Protein of unknown function (DUF3048) C-terminal domain/Protein of unknown function (DUF3048) N-terminal domain
VAGFAVALVLAATACSKGPPSPVGAGSPSSPATSPRPHVSESTGGSSGPHAPLTGLRTASAADAARPAVAVAVTGPNPRGLTAADVVFEEITAPARYIAVYQSQQSTGIGPVTSTQPTDVQELSVLHPLFGYNGAVAPFFLKLLDKSKLSDVGFANHPSAYSSTAAGLTASTRAISGDVRAASAPPPIFQYRGGDSGANTLAAKGVSRPSSVRITLPGHGTQTWHFDSRADRWTPTSGTPRCRAANLVVQTVPYKVIGVNRQKGITVSSARVIGTGKAAVFSGSESGDSSGTAATGTWSKPRAGDVTNYLDASGYPMTFQAGPTWIILGPPGTQVITSGGR